MRKVLRREHGHSALPRWLARTRIVVIRTAFIGAVIDYEGDDFYFRTLTAGYYLWKDQENQLSIMGYYTPWGYRPGDSDDDRMKRLDKSAAAR